MGARFEESACLVWSGDILSEVAISRMICSRAASHPGVADLTRFTISSVCGENACGSFPAATASGAGSGGAATATPEASGAELASVSTGPASAGADASSGAGSSMTADEHFVKAREQSR